MKIDLCLLPVLLVVPKPLHMTLGYIHWISIVSHESWNQFFFPCVDYLNEDTESCFLIQNIIVLGSYLFISWALDWLWLHTTTRQTWSWRASQCRECLQAANLSKLKHNLIRTKFQFWSQDKYFFSIFCYLHFNELFLMKKEIRTGFWFCRLQNNSCFSLANKFWNQCD